MIEVMFSLFTIIDDIWVERGYILYEYNKFEQ